MSRDHSTTAWTPDWLGETPGAVDERHAGPAHAAPDPNDSNDETRELIDLDAPEFADELIPALADDPMPVFTDEPIPALADDRPLVFADDPIPDQSRARRGRPLPPGRPVAREGWAEERGYVHADGAPDPAVGSLRSLGAVAVTGRRATVPPKSPRPGQTRRGTGSPRGLVALVLLALLAAFFAWVTAEPLWLAAGHY